MAATLKFITSGNITSYRFMGAPDPGIQVGDPFTGTLSYDTNPDGSVVPLTINFAMMVNGILFSSWYNGESQLQSDNPLIEPLNPTANFTFVSSGTLNPWNWSDGDAVLEFGPGTSPVYSFRGTADAYQTTDVHIKGEVTSITRVPESPGVCGELLSVLFAATGHRRRRSGSGSPGPKAKRASK